MGLREKVALTIAVIIFIQIILGTCSSKNKTSKSVSTKQKRSIDRATSPSTVKTIYTSGQGQKNKNKIPSVKNHEAIRKTFNFPDVEYPTAPAPRPPFYLQEANILQRNVDQLPTENHSSTSDQYSKIGRNKKKKYDTLAKFKTIKPAITNIFPKSSSISKPYCYNEGLFPEVEYPLTAWETWKPYYWESPPSYGLKNNGNNDSPIRFSQSETKLKPNGPLSKSVPSPAISKLDALKKFTVLNTAPLPGDVDTTIPAEPYNLTPYTSLYFDTIPSYIDTQKDENKDTVTSKQSKSNKKIKQTKNKKSINKETSLTPTKELSMKDDDRINSTPVHDAITSLKKDESPISKSQEGLFSVVSDKRTSNGNLSKLDTGSNIFNQTFSNNGTLSPSLHTSDNPTTAIPIKIHSDDKIPTFCYDNKVALVSDAINRVVSENTDNKVSYFEDNVRNSNNSSACDIDEEFTTDVFLDFDENILSVSTSTMSPMSLIDIDDEWANSVVIDPYKSVAYPDELEQFYIAIP